MTFRNLGETAPKLAVPNSPVGVSNAPPIAPSFGQLPLAQKGAGAILAKTLGNNRNLVKTGTSGLNRRGLNPEGSF